MKKIFSLFALVLFSCMGAWAQGTVAGAKGTIYTSPAMEDGEFVSGTKFYTIEIGRNNCQLDSRYLPTVQQKKATACDQNKWAVYAATGGYQFINKATKKALTFASTANDAVSSLTENFEDPNSVFEFTTTQNSVFADGFEVFLIAGTEDAYPNDKNNGLAIWKSTQALWGWQGSADNPKNGDDGSKFKFTMVEELVATTYTINVVGAPVGVTVVVSVNGNEKPVGTPFNLPSSIEAGAVTSTEIPAYTYEVVVGEGTITVTYTYNPYAVNYDKDGNKKGTDRNINSVCLTQADEQLQSFEVTNPGKTYNDLTAQVFTVEAGSTVTPNMVGVGSWYHGYVYVDVDNNGAFGVDATELVSYTAYREGETGQAHNSAGQTFNAGGGTAWSDGVNGKFPSFVAPAIGTYRMRFKTDWNNIDPAGGPTMWNDRGQIIDVTLEVVAPAPKANVTYEVYLGEEKLYEEVKEENVGGTTAYALNSSAADYVNVEHTPVTITGDMKVRVNTSYKETLPFKTDGTLYNLALNRTPNLQIYVSGEDINTIAANDASYVAPTYANQNFYKWAIRGDWYKGFTLWNAGAEKYVSYGTNNPSNNAAEAKASLAEDTTGEGSHFELRIKNNAQYYFRLMGTTNAAYISNNGGSGTTYLTTWNNENNYNNDDAGAQFIFTEAVEIPAIDWTTFATKISTLKQYTFGEGLGEYAEVDLSEYYINSVDQALGLFEEDLENTDVTRYEEDLEIMDFIQHNLHLNMPKAGDLLVIKGATTGKYVYADADAEADNGAATQLAQGDLGWPNDPESYGKWASAIFYFDGEHLISYNSPSGSGFYVFRSGLSNNPAKPKDDITFHEGSKVGCYRIHTANANSNWYDFYGSTGRINRWSANDAELTNFVIEQPSYDYVHIGSAGYATVCLPVDVAWEYGESGAYTVNEVDGVLKATRINGCIPAGVPAVITGEPGNYILKPAGRWAPADAEQFTTNVLRGTYAAMGKPANALVFNVNDEVPGFYGFTGAYLNGFKAYYENPTGASNLRINFEGTLTAIESAVEAAQGHQIFDLQGRRVNGVAHGLFIQNGKKVIK